MSYGANAKWALGLQTAGGTAVSDAGSFHLVPLLTEDVGLEKDELISQNLTGVFEQGTVYDGVSQVAGTVEFEVTPRAVGALLAAAVNTPTVVSSDSLQTYTYVPRTLDYSSTLCNAPITIYKQFSDASSAENFYDCQLGQLEFQVRNGELLRGRINVVAGKRTATGVGSLGVDLGLIDSGKHWTWDTASVSLGGAGRTDFRELTVTLNENIEPIYSLDGTLQPTKFTRGGFREVTVAGTFLMSDREILNDFAAGTQKQLRATFSNSRYIPQSGYPISLEVDVPQMKITQFKPSITGVGEVEVSFQARGVVDPTSNYAVQYILQNTWAAY